MTASTVGTVAGRFSVAEAFREVSAPERLRGGAMGILPACIGAQPLGALAIGLPGGLGVSPAFTVTALAALVVIVPLAVPLLRGRPDCASHRSRTAGGGAWS